MGNSHSAPATTGSIRCFPDPSNKSLLTQSVVKEGGDWGKDAHRHPVFVDGKPKWREELNSGLNGRFTLYENFQRTVKENGHRPWVGSRKILSDGSPGPYQFITYKEGAAKADEIGSGLLALGLKPKKPVGLYSKNRTEWVFTEQACNAYSFPTVAIYDTLGAESVHYVMNHSEMVVVLFEEKQIDIVLSSAQKGLPDLKIAICFDNVTDENRKAYKSAGVDLYTLDEVVAKGRASIKPHTPPAADDLAILMYTSGTTGSPKGVMISHSNAMSELSALANTMPLVQDDIHFSFLPLAHIFERLVQAYCVTFASSIGFYRGLIPQLMLDVQALQPTFFVAVPRVLTRIYDKITQGVKAAGGVKEMLFNAAFSARHAALLNGQDTPFYNALVFNKLKLALGGRVRFMITGSAPLDTTVHDFLRVCVCPVIMVGYGLTETTAGLSLTHPHDLKLGHCGPPLDSCEVKLVDIPEMSYLTTDKEPRGEVCVRGHSVFKGYFKNPEKTKEDIDEDGWFHTGDVGRWNPNGTLSIIDRKKSIFKLAQGEYLAAEYLETQYGKCEHVAQVFVYGDPFRTYPLAVIVPDFEVVLPWAKKNNISGDFKAICETPELKSLITKEIKGVHAEFKLKGYELVKDFIIESEVFDINNELLTPTFKLKRPSATKKYKEALTAMYDRVDAELAAKQAAKERAAK
eukprot:CFRG6999T1